MEERIIEIIESLTDFKDLRKNREIDLLENEILDSLAFIELIEALEEEFDIEIQPTQVSPDTWRNVKKIAEMVEKRR
ncbi:MAG: D-alanine--poly(phosphoribitol) ligase subunit 2 [Clostridia bacterium]|nr:D-alanine--poly(phosphoribitol) ligase subunit 2 [Clostridia bacterium]